MIALVAPAAVAEVRKRRPMTFNGIGATIEK
jgi:hypothetical protein